MFHHPEVVIHFVRKMEDGEIQSVLKRKNIEFSVQRYLIDAMSHMALGLFASLLVGTILNSLGTWLNIPFLSETVWPIAKSMMGPAIGVAVAYGLKAPPFVLFASAITGAAGDSLGGGPVGAFVAAVIGAEFGKAVSKETKVDLIVTPAVTILTGVLIGKFVGPGIAKFMTGLGQMIIYATTLQPFWMGILVSVLVGLALTAPISSAALCIMLGLEGLAAGAQRRDAAPRWWDLPLSASRTTVGAVPSPKESEPPCCRFPTS